MSQNGLEFILKVTGLILATMVLIHILGTI
jgi:hypothetical protein